MSDDEEDLIPLSVDPEMLQRKKAKKRKEQVLPLLLRSCHSLNPLVQEGGEGKEARPTKRARKEAEGKEGKEEKGVKDTK